MLHVWYVFVHSLVLAVFIHGVYTVVYTTVCLDICIQWTGWLCSSEAWGKHLPCLLGWGQDHRVVSCGKKEVSRELLRPRAGYKVKALWQWPQDTAEAES